MSVFEKCMVLFCFRLVFISEPLSSLAAYTPEPVVFRNGGDQFPDTHTGGVDAEVIRLPLSPWMRCDNVVELCAGSVDPLHLAEHFPVREFFALRSSAAATRKLGSFIGIDKELEGLLLLKQCISGTADKDHGRRRCSRLWWRVPG